MSANGRLEPTGFELQDTLAEAVGDPIGDALALLDAQPLQRLILEHKKNDVHRFMASHHVPARNVDITAARRVLPAIRRDPQGERIRAIGWLTSQLGPRIHNALVTAVGPEHAKRGHREEDLDEVIADYSEPAVRLAVFAEWGAQLCELDLAMLITDGRAVADRWRPHLDRLGPIAEGIVAEFKEAHEEMQEAADVLGLKDEEADADSNDEVEIDDSGLDDSGLEDATCEHAGFDEPAELDRDSHGKEQGVSASGADGGDTGSVGDVAAGTSERVALDALDALESAARHFAAALAILKSEQQLAHRLATVRATAPGALEESTLAELRAFAAGPLDTADIAFLDALAILAELSSGGAGDAEIMAAEEAVRAFPAARRFRAVLFAAARGRLVLASGPELDDRLLPWVDEGQDELRVPIPPPSCAVAPVEAPAIELPPVQQAAGASATTGSVLPDAPAKGVTGTPERDQVTAVQPARPFHQAAGKPESATSETEPAPPGVSAPDGAPSSALPGEVTATRGSSQEASAEVSSENVPDVGQPAAESKATQPVETKEAAPAHGAAVDQTPADLVTMTKGEMPSGTATDELVGIATADERDTDLRPDHSADSDYDTAYGQMFADGRFGLARWLATALGDSARANALEAIAYADGARSATGALATALTGTLEALGPQRLSGDRPCQILAVAAATRAAIVTPFSDVIRPLTQLAQIFHDDAPAIAAIAEAAVASAQQGVAYTGDLIASLGGAAAVDSKIADISANAEAQLKRLGRTGFTRADKIWNDWVASGGPINELLAPVAVGDAAAAPVVRAAVFNYSKDSFRQQLLRDSDDLHRGPGKPRLEGLRRTTLLERLDRALEIASAWLELQQASARTGRANDHETAVAARLRAIIVAQRERLESTLESWSAVVDPMLAGAARGAARLYHDTFALTEGVALPGEEQDTGTILDVDLLRTDIALGPNLRPLDRGAITPDAVAVALNRSWQEAFDSRVAEDDHVATAAIVATIASTNQQYAADLAALRGAALDQARRRVAQRAGELVTLLRAARRAGRINEDAAEALTAQISLASQDGRDDLGAASAELDAVSADLKHAAAVEVAAFRARVSQAAASWPAVADAVERFEALLAESDLATAEELFFQLQEGGSLPGEHHPSIDFGEFFPAVVDHLASGITIELIGRARRREVDGPLDFRPLSPEAAESAAAALEAWRSVAVGERQQKKAQQLTPALRALGLEFRGERNANLPGSNDRSWIDLHGVDRVPQTLAPAFGTYAGDTQRLLLVWKQPGESLLEWIEQDVSERPVLVLYFGTMAPNVRRRIANRLRSRSARPVAVIDDAVVAFAASRGTQTFEVTMRATLPFTAVNPYEPDIAGSVPEEMFYGRIAERSAVMSETGTSLIYGGRRLGKSALLRAAQRRFDSVDGQEAIYIDLSAAGIRNSKRPEAVWDLIAARLVAKGIAERPNTKRALADPFERTDAAMRSWLAGRDGRRLLVLLDECDDFFDVDAETDFAQTRRLKDLMESTARHFKVVFAGLHQVARFASYPNQPLAHLGKPQPIGPLAPQYAHNLLAKPLAALGWRFESENLINRVLTHCNYTPILLQVFGHSLVKHLHAHHLEAQEPPSVITAADIDAVLGSASIDQAIHSRFDLTLSLDPRYKMVAYVLALETLAGAERSAVSARMTAEALREECRTWWPEGFADVRDDEFRALLDELVALGVLRQDSGEWRMRSRNVLNLLGTRAAIGDGLLGIARENPPTGGMFFGEARRRVTLRDGSVLRSPFSEQQLSNVIGDGRNQLSVVVGTRATGVEDVLGTLTATHDFLGRFELITPPRVAVFEQAVSDVPASSHRVVFSDLRAVGEDSVLRSIAATGKHPANPGASCSAVLLISPAMLPLVGQALSSVGLEDDAIVPLRRYSTQALRSWAVEIESGFTDDQIRRRLLEVTNGWPILVAEAERLAKQENAYRAVAEIETLLTRRPKWLLREMGLDDPVLVPAWRTALEVLGDGEEPSDALASFLDENSEAGEGLARALVAAGLLIDNDGILRIEPVAALAWHLALREDTV